MNDLTQPPEGILDPEQPYWPADRVGEKTWLKLKGKLTGRKIEQLGGEQHTSYVNITEADADKVIENIKKYGQYPQVNQNDKYGGAYNNEIYQKWLVEEFLEKPFQKQRDAKIEDAAIEARLQEIQEEKSKKKAEKDKETVPPDKKEEEKKQEQEQEILDGDQQAIEEQVSEITTELDSVSEEEKKADSSDTKEEQKNPEKDKMSSDVEGISDSLKIIRGSLQTQVSDFGSINRESTKSLSALEGLKQLFQAQTDIIKREADLAERQSSEKSLEQSQDVSGSVDSTSTMDSGKAEGVITNTSPGIGGGVNVLTVKPTEGEFAKGQKISQGGGGGFDLMGMIKGIAGKFGGGKGGGGGGGGSPIKMSQGGFLNSPYPSQSMAQGGFAPGVYDKPTRGNLLPGQAVIPMNRNVGKKIFGGDKEAQKKQQPLIDTMSQPLKAVGLAILTTAGNFLSSLGPLAGFFLPYAKGLVSGFSKVLGVPIAIIESLLGGPAYAAAQEQDKQQDVFAKLWADVMKKFGFGFLFGGDKKKKKKGETGGDPDVGPIEDGPMFEKGARIAKKLQQLLSIEDYQAAAIVGNLIQESSLVPDRMQGPGMQRGPLKVDGRTGYSYPQWTDAGRQQAFANYMESKGHDWRTVGATDELATGFLAKEFKTYMSSVFTGTKDVAAASNWVLRNYEKPADQGSSEQSERATDSNSVLSKMSAESGINNSMGKMLGWSVMDGPNSGYPVGDNLTMHGKEAYLQHERGMSILPIENNEYSLSKKPAETLDRWKEILGPSNNVNGNGEYARGGSSSQADMRRKIAQSEKNKTVAKRSAAATKQRLILGVVKGGNKSGYSVIKTGMREGENENQWGERQSQALRMVDQLNKQSGLGKYAARLNKEETLTAPRKATALISQSKSQKPTAATAKTPEKTETDLMMEQYNILTAAGKHSEAKELGMQIWNKTWRKKGAGIERIPTTPISATATQAAIAAAKPSGGAGSSITPMVIPIPSGGGASITTLPVNPVEQFYKQRDLLIARTFC